MAHAGREAATCPRSEGWREVGLLWGTRPDAAHSGGGGVRLGTAAAAGGGRGVRKQAL